MNGAKRSAVWEFVTDIGDNYALCNICQTKLCYKSTVTNLKKHVKRKHPGVKIGKVFEEEPELNISSEEKQQKSANSSTVPDPLDSSSETEDFKTEKPTSFPSQSRKKQVLKSSKKKHYSLSIPGYEITSSRVDKQTTLEKWDIIGRNIGVQLKDLDRKQFFIAQKIIHEALYYGQMGVLTEYSCVTGLAQNESAPGSESPGSDTPAKKVYEQQNIVDSD